MSFRITILGSSGALPAYERYPSSQLIEIQNRHFLVDCGEGAQMQLMRYGVSMHRIAHIFISHLHGDHYLGLMGLIYTMHLMRRTNELNLYAPPGLDDIITTQFKHSRSTPSYPIIFHRLRAETPALIFEDSALTVHTIPLKHKLPCTGFLFREKAKPRRIVKEKLPPNLSIRQLADLKRGADVTDEEGALLYPNDTLTINPKKSRSYAYCADTAFHEPILQQIRGIDLLYHESTFMESDRDKAMETLHSTAKDAATISLKANAGKLIIGHFSARYKTLEALLAEAQAIFSNTALATEGTVFDIAE